MKYLLDTMVVSELIKRRRNPTVIAWLADRKFEEIFISVLTLGEINRGISLQRNINPEFALRLDEWFQNLIKTYKENMLPVSEEIALIFGSIYALTGNAGIDNLIAATAKVHNLVVVTRHIRHFQQTGVECVNPWEKA